MLADERLAIVLDRINTTGRVSAAELAVEFCTSEDTIRRDLRDLAARGLCRRVYGGALRNMSGADSAAVRATRDGPRKRALGEALVQFITPGQFVFIDAGTTNLAAARAFPPGLGLRVATHDPSIAAALSGREDVDLLVIGGRIDPVVGAALGIEAAQAISALRPDLLLLGACALDAVAGLGAFHPEDAAAKRLLIARSAATATALLTEKLGDTAPFHIGAASALGDCVVEADAPDAALAPLLAQGLRLHRCGPVQGSPTLTERPRAAP